MFIFRNHGEEVPEPRLVGASAKNTILANYRVAFYNKDKLMIGLGKLRWTRPKERFDFRIINPEENNNFNYIW